MNICIVAGARPNFIKIAPIVWAVEKAQQEGRDIAFCLVYAGAEADKGLEPSLFSDLQIAPPSVYLGVESANLNEITGQVMARFEQYLAVHKTDAVIVVDDLASTMAASIVAKKQGLLLAHLVAGTRSFDISMPKEVNRLVIDGLSDLLFTAGLSATSIASREGAENEKIYMVGNILIDTLRRNRARFVPPIFSTWEKQEGAKFALPLGGDGGGYPPYLVLTINRKALLSNEKNLQRMLSRIDSLCEGVPVIAPLRADAAAEVSRLLPKQTHIRVCKPLSYLQFGYLTQHAKGIITDSGNVAEEATFNGVPCITLNSYTEHMDTVTVGTNELVGEDADRLGTLLQQMVHGEWKKGRLPDRWDGRSAERIVHILLERKSRQESH